MKLRACPIFSNLGKNLLIQSVERKGVMKKEKKYNRWLIEVASKIAGKECKIEQIMCPQCNKQCIDYLYTSLQLFTKIKIQTHLFIV